MFLYKNLFFSKSILSIRIMLIGINGGYFPAICRVCFEFVVALRIPNHFPAQNRVNRLNYPRKSVTKSHTFCITVVCKRGVDFLA